MRQVPQPSFTRMERAPTPPNGIPLAPATPRRPYANGRSEVSQSRPVEVQNPNSVVPIPPTVTTPRPRRQRQDSTDASAAYTATAPVAVPERAATPSSRNRAGTPSSQIEQMPPPVTLRPGRSRRPSNASSTVRSSAATANVPSIALSSSPDRSTFSSSPPPIPPSIPPATPVSPPAVTPTTFTRKMKGAAYPTSFGAALEVPVASSSQVTSSPVSAYEQSLDASRIRNGSPAPPSRKASTSAEATQTRREPNARVSFFDPANQAALDRLLSGDITLQDDWDEDAAGEGEVAEETAQAMLTSVEEMLEGYEWASGDLLMGAGRGTTDLIEARLLDELMALDKVCASPLAETCRVSFLSTGEYTLVPRIG